MEIAKEKQILFSGEHSLEKTLFCYCAAECDVCKSCNFALTIFCDVVSCMSDGILVSGSVHLIFVAFIMIDLIS